MKRRIFPLTDERAPNPGLGCGRDDRPDGYLGVGSGRWPPVCRKAPHAKRRGCGRARSRPRPMLRQRHRSGGRRQGVPRSPRQITVARTQSARPIQLCLTPPTTGKFIATATENAPTYFARVLGISQTTVLATAKAACGPSPVACGLFPLAFSQSIWDDVATQCGQKFYVWEHEQDREGGNPNQPTPVPPDCTRCDCSTVYDHQGDLIPGAIAVADVGRGLA